jgi:methylated-DNA-[protein]-cysteine S-methyltransferase
MIEVGKALRETGRLSFDEESARAAARLTTEADRESLVDVAYAVVDSPMGPLTAATTPRGLVRLAYPGEEGVLEELSARISPRVLEVPARLDRIHRELDDYFDKRLRRFRFAVDWALVGPFARKILAVTAQIPYGTVRSYGDVAARTGNPRASRAAGNALGSNPIPIVVPCHRVVRSGGALGGYTGGLDRKEFLLRLEGFLQ